MPGALKPLGAGFLPMISGVAEGLGTALDEKAVGRVAAWFDLIATWNAKVDLTAARTSEELADLMLADALVLARHEPPGRSVVDIGSGAGGPGLALHLARPDLAMTLVEPLQKRGSFLRTVPGPLGARAGSGSLRLVRARRGDPPNTEPLFGPAVARATPAPHEGLRPGGPLGAGGGP